MTTKTNDLVVYVHDSVLYEVPKTMTAEATERLMELVKALPEPFNGKLLFDHPNLEWVEWAKRDYASYPPLSSASLFSLDGLMADPDIIDIAPIPTPISPEVALAAWLKERDIHNHVRRIDEWNFVWT